jgi:very-short-patch-repair endonuclease
MQAEGELGNWLDALRAGRARCVFTDDVLDASKLLQRAAESAREPLRVVALTWQDVPPLANELGLLVSALAQATLEFFPSLYARQQSPSPRRWSQTFDETEAHAITRAVEGVDGFACRRILSASRRGEVASLGKIPAAEQARQFALAIQPERLLIIIAVSTPPEHGEPLKSLAAGAEWLAQTTESRVALVLPRELMGRSDLDHVAYGSCDFVDDNTTATAVEATAPRSRRQEPTAAASLPHDGAAATRLMAASTTTTSAVPPTIDLSPIEGQPAKHSDAEQHLYQALTSDAELRPLFAYNQRVQTSAGTSPRVDLLWEAGKLVIEVDGPDHRRARQFANDRVRDLELLLSGYRVVRFTEGRVLENTRWVVEQLRQTVRYCRNQEAD